MKNIKRLTKISTASVNNEVVKYVNALDLKTSKELLKQINLLKDVIKKLEDKVDLNKFNQDIVNADVEVRLTDGDDSV